jgi:sulfur-oxidizing protein SoxY
VTSPHHPHAGQRRRRWLALPWALAASATAARLTTAAGAAGAISTALSLLATTAAAAPGGLPSAAHGDSSPEWDALRPRLFGDRPVLSGSGRVQVQAPLRAAYGASVPVKVTALLPQSEALRVQKLWLVVDKNPSPVAAVINVSAALGQADFETRMRVDEYSHVRAVVELSDGSLHADSRYVKTSGGCSAPPNRDSPELIGRTTLRLAAPFQRDGLNTADVTVLHPNDTGFELNNVTVMYIPSYFVRSIKVSQGGAPLFDAELDFSISENPTLRFHFVPQGLGELRAEVEDSKERHYEGRLALQ